MDSTNVVVDALRKLTTDYPYFCNQVYRIRKKKREKEESGERIPWVFNAVQTYCWEQCQGDDEILKMRAAGVSTYYQGITVWDGIRRKNTGCVVVVDRDDLSIEFRKIIGEFVGDIGTYYTEVLGIDPPMIRQDNKDMLWFANPDIYGREGLNSKIAIVPAKSKGAGVGFVIDRLTFSEIGRYEEVCDPEQLMLRINQSVPDSGARVTKESASYGGTYWRSVFKSSNGFKKHFIPWVANEDYTVELTQEQANFKLSGSKESTWGDEVSLVPLIRKELIKWFPKLYGPTIEPEGVIGNKFLDADIPERAVALEHEIRCRLAWRRWCIRRKCNNSWTDFAQQYPLTEDEAFLSAGNYAFSQGKLNAWAEFLENNPFDCEKFVYDKNFDLSESKWWLKQIRKVDIGGDIFIYERPRPGFRYGVSVDPSLGIPDRDHGSIRVWRFPQNVEVAAYDKPTDPYELADLAYGLAQWFNNAIIGVEIRGQGYAVIRRLMEGSYYFPNPRPRLFYSKFTANRTDPVYMYGFDTNRETKKSIVADFKDGIDNDAFVLTHPPTVDQCKNYQKGTDGKYSCGTKKQDNAVISSMINYQLSKSTNDWWEREPEKEKRRGPTLRDWAAAMRNAG